jgi:hypothetical protein
MRTAVGVIGVSEDVGLTIQACLTFAGDEAGDAETLDYIRDRLRLVYRFEPEPKNPPS